jgi:hypothetical protein
VEQHWADDLTAMRPHWADDMIAQAWEGIPRGPIDDDDRRTLAAVFWAARDHRAAGYTLEGAILRCALASRETDDAKRAVQLAVTSRMIRLCWPRD